MASSLLPASLLSHLTFLPQPAADFLPTLYETTTSTILAFLSLSPTSEANSTTWAGAVNDVWTMAVQAHPVLFGFGSGPLGLLCATFRVLAYICIGPFALLILLVSPICSHRVTGASWVSWPRSGGSGRDPG